MRNCKKSICVLLCTVLLCLCAFVNVSAQTQQGRIIISDVRMRTAATTSGTTVLQTVPIGTVVTVLGSTNGQEAESGGGTTWYYIEYGGQQGYVYGKYLSLINGVQTAFNEDFEQNLLNFPESYRDSLRNLHAMFPNWKFVAHYVNISLEDAIAAQYGMNSVKDNLKFVELTFGGDEWRDMRAYEGNDKWTQPESRWTYASYGAIAHYMDPRTSLTQYSMYVFMQQSFDAETQTKESLRSVTNGTFLANGYDGDPDAYLDDIMDAATQSGVSPYVLAATIIIEQGTDGTSTLISGETGYYNFFNFGTSGETYEQLVNSGLAYAQSAGWDTREKSIIGGAKKYADGYIAVGQDTYYYKDFNVVNQAWHHQYAQSLYDAWINGAYLRKAFENNPQAELVFKIPVYTSMRDAIYQSPSVETNLPPDTPEQPTQPTIAKGDTNFDNTINAIDLAAIKMHILGVKTVEGDSSTAADVNSDGLINAIDLAAVKMHILGVKTIP